MAQDSIGRNQVFPIYNADETPFHGLVLHKSTVESVIMSLGDKISGDVLYKDNTLVFTMQEYIEYDGVKYVLVSPPTVVREGKVSDNGELKGMTKYSLTFYHPMYMLGNFPFTDVAVTQDERRYLSQNKTFSWIGNLFDFVAKINANLEGTEWVVSANIQHFEQDGTTVTAEWQKASKISDVLSFDKQFVSDAMKTAFDTWEIPFTIVKTTATGKKFLVEFGLPSQEIYQQDGVTPFVFQFGKGVGLANNSRTPRNNKIITRIAGTGEERNIPYGYPQIVWTGNQSWEYTINNAEGMQEITIGGQTVMAMSYPIYDGIVGGQKVRLIKHPFTRKTLMPSIYAETVNKKVNPNAVGYDPDTVIVDYYDATVLERYPNPINPLAPSFENHQFENIYPRLGDASLVSVLPYDDREYISTTAFKAFLDTQIAASNNENERYWLRWCKTAVDTAKNSFSASNNGGSYTFSVDGIGKVYGGGIWFDIKYVSDSVNFEYNVYRGSYNPSTAVEWDDTMDDDGKLTQEYFKLRLPQLTFDLYASAAITESMEVNMRSGACLGCTFPIQVDWDDYKRNFYDADGNFDPVIGTGHPRDGQKYPDSSQGQINVIVQKDINTFGTIMPDIYKQPASGDKFVILGISLPLSYISTAELELDAAMKEYMLENNVHYFDYPLKFDEYFLATHTEILSQIKNNSIVRFRYAGTDMALYVKQITVKYYDGVLPKYDITLTDDVEIVLSKIGQVTDDVSRMRVQLTELQRYYSEDIINVIAEKLSKVADYVCLGRITFQQGLTAAGNVIFGSEVRSADYENGLGGRGWRVDNLGNAEFESARIRSFLEVIELIINRQQAYEGDAVYTDNDQIDKVERIVDETDNSVSYILSLKEKYDGYITSQMYGNILKGVINTLAAKESGVSDESANNPNKQGTDDGGNKYYTSWMRVIGTQSTSAILGKNQIQVVLYGDNDVPAQKNFEPCELMTIARRGCVQYGDPSDAFLQASINRRQRFFEISVTDGRVTKYTGVDRPIMVNGNYGVTIGELPDFVKNYTKVREVLNQVGEHTDWLYAQGIVVANMISVTREGIPIPNIVDCGEWIDGNRTDPLTIQVWDAQQQRYVDHVLTFPIPSTEYDNPESLYIGHGIYFYNQYNALTQQYETHRVRHDSGTWTCLQSQPVVSGGVATYYEPKWNSSYWQLADGNENLSIEFESSRGYSFRRGAVDTVITPYLFYGNVDISDDVAAEFWSWTRQSETGGKTTEDESWDARHQHQKSLHLTNADMPATWSSTNREVFTLTVTLNDGRSQTIVQNQVIS